MHARGEKHHRSRISDQRVREMRSKYHELKAKRKGIGYRVIARLFGVNRWTVRDIVTYRTRIDA
jgi:hypothetical protein